MSEIILSAEQARIVETATATVAVRNPDGHVIAYLSPPDGFSDEDIAAAKAAIASDQPRYTTSEVLEHLRSLERR
jgi:hypothetical protein